MLGGASVMIHGAVEHHSDMLTALLRDGLSELHVEPREILVNTRIKTANLKLLQQGYRYHKLREKNTMN